MSVRVVDERLVRRAPKSTEDLLALLFDGLDWPRPPHMEIEDIPLMQWTPNELHLNPDAVARLTRIQQLPALTGDQKFGVFLLTFDGGRLPVGAIKRIVNRLVRKKRAGSNAGGHAVWNLDDLLFFCLSSDGVATLHVVAFQERDRKPVLRVASWSASATDNRIGLVARSALPALAWPHNDRDLASWKQTWLNGFTSHREGITTAKRLAQTMAQVARDVRDGVQELYEVESDDGPLRTLAGEIKANLLDDLTPETFADMFAETMVYGLLTARITHPEDFAADALATAFRFDNPFLESVYARFKEQAGDSVDIDELGLAELADALSAANIAEVLADFGTEGRRDDPVVHFYEDFLADYNPEKRIELGVYYTPQPVVRYIIRSVDETLKRDFDLPLGIADPTTWRELSERFDGFEIPDGVDPDPGLRFDARSLHRDGHVPRRVDSLRRGDRSGARPSPRCVTKRRGQGVALGPYGHHPPEHGRLRDHDGVLRCRPSEGLVDAPGRVARAVPTADLPDQHTSRSERQRRHARLRR
jgi:hypothetical protein